MIGPRGALRISLVNAGSSLVDRIRRRCLAGALAVACGGEKTPEAQKIEIGFFGALTGPQATFAISGRNGARLAIDQLNAAGGVLGKKLDLLVEDDHNDPSEAASAVSKLITRDHVVALIGEQASSRSLAAAPIAQNYQVPMVSPSSTNVEVTKKGDYIFRVCFIDSYQGKAVATFAWQTLQAKTAALLVDAKSDYSVGLAESFRTAFTAAGRPDRRGGRSTRKATAISPRS